MPMASGNSHFRLKFMPLRLRANSYRPAPPLVIILCSNLMCAITPRYADRDAASTLVAQIEHTAEAEDDGG